MNPVQTTLLDKSAFTHVGTGICLYESWLNCTRPVSIWMCMCGHTQLCPTLCNPMDCSPPGSSVHWILQARILEWVPIYNFRGSSWPRDQTCISCVSWYGIWIPYHCATWEINWVNKSMKKDPSSLSVSGDLPKEDAVLIREGGGKPSTRKLQGDHP